MIPRVAGLWLAIAVATLAVPRCVGAFERAVTDVGIPLQWRTSCVVYHINERGSEDVPVEQMRAALQAAFETWSQVESSYLVFVYGGLTNQLEPGPGSKRNVVTWIEDESDWVFVDADVVGLTTLTFESDTGSLLDADIEFNGAWFEFNTEAGTTDYDIEATAVHEIGHLLGLADSEIPAAVMHATHARGTIERRELHLDDIEAISTLYPTASDPGVCDESAVGDYYPSGVGPQNSGCSSAMATPAGPGAGTWALILMALLGFLAARRRVLVAALLLVSFDASAYRIYTSPEDATVPLRWYTEDIEVWFHDREPQELGLDLASAEIRASFEAWLGLICQDRPGSVSIAWQSTRKCSVGYDPTPGAINENCILWVPGVVAWSHGKEVLALTSLTFDTVTGEIVDADLELNDANFQFALNPESDQADLRNTVTHEAGHFMGLDHSLNHEATMYAKAPLGETAKRDLEADDVAGFCALYGPDAPDTVPVTASYVPPSATPGSSCLAQTASGQGGPLSALIMGLIAMFGIIRTWSS
ncbi:MAG: MYXO-CTERM domain-containing protein [Myxococcota bacterium]